MASVLAIVSKAVFERDARGADGALAEPGQTLPLDRYLSANKGLAPLGEGGALFMVTVRPPDERLWLVAVLRDPTFQGDRWQAAPNTVPLTDITELLPQIELQNGKGIKPKPGRMGMSLQTPRALNEADVALLLQAAQVGGGPADDAVSAAAPGPYADLLADVIAAPDDDAPRLVLADRLMEQGDPRGEFIAAQVQLASRGISALSGWSCASASARCWRSTSRPGPTSVRAAGEAEHRSAASSAASSWRSRPQRSSCWPRPIRSLPPSRCAG